MKSEIWNGREIGERVERVEENTWPKLSSLHFPCFAFYLTNNIAVVAVRKVEESSEEIFKTRTEYLEVGERESK